MVSFRSSEGFSLSLRNDGAEWPLWGSRTPPAKRGSLLVPGVVAIFAAAASVRFVRIADLGRLRSFIQARQKVSDDRFEPKLPNCCSLNGCPLWSFLYLKILSVIWVFGRNLGRRQHSATSPTARCEAGCWHRGCDARREAEMFRHQSAGACGRC